MIAACIDQRSTVLGNHQLTHSDGGFDTNRLTLLQRVAGFATLTVAVRTEITTSSTLRLNPIKGTLKPQSNRPLYRNTVTGTLAVNGWTDCYIWYSKEGTGRDRSPPSPLLLYQMYITHQRPVYQLHIIRRSKYII